MKEHIRIFDYSLCTVYPDWPFTKQTIINTLNPHSFCVAAQDSHFKTALQTSDILIPDGIGIVYAVRMLCNLKIRRIAGADMHRHLLQEAQRKSLKVFYLGASNDTLQRIKNRIAGEYPAIEVGLYSPPFKKQFSEEDNTKMIATVNQFAPDFLFVGMTAPKQEKWSYTHKNQLNAKAIIAIGAVFDFYAGTKSRAPNWLINLGCEWLHRFLKEPKRMWRRYLISNPQFIYYVFKEKFFGNKNTPDQRKH